MQDTKSASLVLIAGAAGMAWWWYHITQGRLAPAAASPTDPTGGPALGKGPITSLQGDPLSRLKLFAAQWGLAIESGFRTGNNSLHGEGRAIDVKPPPLALQEQIKQDAERLGIHVYPEAPGQRGANGSVSTGWHWHLSFPEVRNGRAVF